MKPDMWLKRQTIGPSPLNKRCTMLRNVPLSLNDRPERQSRELLSWSAKPRRPKLASIKSNSSGELHSPSLGLVSARSQNLSKVRIAAIVRGTITMLLRTLTSLKISILALMQIQLKASRLMKFLQPNPFNI